MDVPSIPATLTVTTALAVILAACLFKHIFNGSANKGKYHPVAGTVINQLLNFNRLHHYMAELASKYKTYRLLYLFRSEVYTSDPAVEYILKTNFPNYGKNCPIGSQIMKMKSQLKLFTKSTLETVFKILGVDLDTTSEEGTLFSTSFDEASALTRYRYIDMFWKVKRFLNIGSEANWKKCIIKWLKNLFTKYQQQD
ncbi:cytochrome P450 704C1-like [Nicotiana tabacum]|uniref:Cytochrome P450 704C1-like n=1 Tax=Nicotiana tabacum TaxID=4097 RepID=A0AC58UR15_TOBAC